MKNFLLGVVVTVAVLVVGGFAYLRLGLAQTRSDLPPSKLESWLMSSAVHASVRRNAPNIPNPIAATDENLIAGGKQYLGECAGCHGKPGKPSTLPETLNPPAPQFPIVGTEYSEAQVFWVAKHGVRHSGMFANGVWDSDDELWRLAAYIKRMNALSPHVQEELAKKPK
ncbi:MAG: cytochrome c [Candidatus Korobacteraceae bacterium]